MMVMIIMMIVMMVIVKVGLVLEWVQMVSESCSWLVTDNCDDGNDDDNYDYDEDVMVMIMMIVMCWPSAGMSSDGLGVVLLARNGATGIAETRKPTDGPRLPAASFSLLSPPGLSCHTFRVIHFVPLCDAL